MVRFSASFVTSTCSDSSPNSNPNRSIANSNQVKPWGVSSQCRCLSKIGVEGSILEIVNDEYPHCYTSTYRPLGLTSHPNPEIRENKKDNVHSWRNITANPESEIRNPESDPSGSRKEAKREKVA